MLELSREEARRLAVRAQLLDRPRPDDVVEVIEQLQALQLEPTAAVAPSGDLILWSRLGDEYEPDDLTTALEVDRSLFELGLMVRPMADLPLFLAELAGPPLYESTRAWLVDNEPFVDDILRRLREDGPLAAREIDDTSIIPWRTSGWSDNKNVQMMLEVLGNRGRIAVSGRRGAERLWDLPSRVFPVDLEAVPLDEAFAERRRRRLRSLGIMRPAQKTPTDPLPVGSTGVEARVEGVKGAWRVDADVLATFAHEPFAGRVALLSPFDRLVADRKRAEQLFEYEYLVEMYKPADKRRWGYFALPILDGDRLVGKLDALADRKAGRFTVNAVHEDVPFDSTTRDAVDAEIAALAAWLELPLVDTRRH